MVNNTNFDDFCIEIINKNNSSDEEILEVLNLLSVDAREFILKLIKDELSSQLEDA